MKKLILFLLITISASAWASPTIMTVTKTPVKALNVGESAFIRPYNGSVRYIMSATAPDIADVKYWMVLKAKDHDLFATIPANLWLSSGGGTVKVLVNKTTD